MKMKPYFCTLIELWIVALFLNMSKAKIPGIPSGYMPTPTIAHSLRGRMPVDQAIGSEFVVLKVFSVIGF